MTVKTPENTWGLPSQVVVTLYEPALAFELTVTVAVAELVPLGERLALEKAFELMVLFERVQAEPSTVSTS